MAAASTLTNDLFASLISDIKTYTGTDPLLPWLQGIRKLRDCLPPQLLKEKLPRFLQKCAQTFQADRRYRNDLRYLRVWIQLMDFVDNPKALLRTMETARIGTKRSLYYQAYALYYEKVKKFEEAEKMYHLGVQNLAEPAAELQKSYEQFLHRLQKQKKKRIQRQEGGPSKRHLTRNILGCHAQNKENSDNMCRVESTSLGSSPENFVLGKLTNGEILKTKVLGDRSFNVVPIKECNDAGVPVKSSDTETISKSSVKKKVLERGPQSHLKLQHDVKRKHEPRSFHNDDTVVVKFVDTTVIGTSEAEDSCHHGLVEPTINTKEAMNAINSMFREPLEPGLVDWTSCRTQPKTVGSKSELKVFTEENLDNRVLPSHRKEEKPFKEPFEIFIDNEDSNEAADESSRSDDLENREGSAWPDSQVKPFVVPIDKDHSSKCSDNLDILRSHCIQVGEDTVVCRFVGSTIQDESKVENACHNGLVEPTVNLKEAMDDINSMFGKPIDFVRPGRLRKKEKAQNRIEECSGFSILPDDNLEQLAAPERDTVVGEFSILPDDDLRSQQLQPPLNPSYKSKGSDLFEPTMFTKEAIDDINKMFGMPLDF